MTPRESVPRGNRPADELRHEISHGGNVTEQNRLLDAALRAERLAALSEVKAAWDADHNGLQCEFDHQSFDTLFDEVGVAGLTEERTT